MLLSSFVMADGTGLKLGSDFRVQVPAVTYVESAVNFCSIKDAVCVVVKTDIDRWW